MHFKFLPYLFILTFIQSLFAQDQIPTVQPQKRPLPQLLMNADSIVLKVDENREATLKMSHADPYTVKVKLDISENLCSEKYEMPLCFYTADVTFDYLALVWTKHSDQTKLGHIVKGIIQNNTRELKSLITYSYLSRFISPAQDTRLKPDRIQCNQYDWLGSQLNSFNESKKLRAQIWSSERMSMNVDTGLNENRSQGQFEDVIFSQSNQVLSLENVGHISSETTTTTAPFLVTGTSSTLQIQNLNQTSSCQISIAHNIQAAAAGIDFDAHFNQNPRFQNFVSQKNLAFKEFKNDLNIYILPNSTELIPEYE